MIRFCLIVIKCYRNVLVLGTLEAWYSMHSPRESRTTTTPFQSKRSTADSIPHGTLPCRYQNQVLELIEANGGVELLFGRDRHLAKIMNNDCDLFGQEGHDIRNRIRGKVAAWKSIYKQNKKDYIKLLKQANVVPFKDRLNLLQRNHCNLLANHPLFQIW